MEQPKPKYVFLLDNKGLLKKLGNKLFLKLFRQRFNYGSYLMQVRGRHPHRDQVFVDNDLIPNSYRDIPARFGETIAIYIREKKDVPV